MSQFADQQRDANRLRQRADETDRARARDTQSDVVIEAPRRLFLRAPGGGWFQLGVTDAGVLTATATANPL